MTSHIQNNIFPPPPPPPPRIRSFERFFRRAGEGISANIVFLVYADFEALTQKISGCSRKDDKSYTEAYQMHIDCGYGYKVICCYDDKYTKSLEQYRGPNAVYKFMEKMLEEVEYCKGVMKKYFTKPLRMTKEGEALFKKTVSCHICEKKYTDKGIRVRDHCHITGKYRGSAQRL